jgi:threonine/homoserine/homoserine lactone efflux protein
MIALAAMPSASVALVVARSATLGIPNGVAVSMGIMLGDLIFIFLAILGLAVIAETMGAMFVIIKYIGGAYLIWFGISLLKSGRKASYTVDESKLKGNLVVSFLSGFVLTLGDIKAIFFYASLFPAFVDIGTLNIIDLTIIILLTIATVGGVKITYAIIANKVVNMAHGMKLESGAKNIAGALMIGTGSYLIVKV